MIEFLDRVPSGLLLVTGLLAIIAVYAVARAMWNANRVPALDVDGIFLDMCWDQPSCSSYAVAAMVKAGLNPEREADRQRYAHDLALRYMARYKRMIDAALELAKVTTEDPFAGIPEASELGSIAGDLDLYYDDVNSLSTPDRIDYARRAERAALDFDPRISNSEGGTFDTAANLCASRSNHKYTTGVV